MLEEDDYSSRKFDLSTLNQDIEKGYIFTIKDEEGNLFWLKTDGGAENDICRKREALCYQIAEIAGIGDVVAPVELITKYNISASSNVDSQILPKQLNSEIINMDKFSYEQALVFSFLTMQRDMNCQNILFTKIIADNREYIKPALIDTAFSITETGDRLDVIDYTYMSSELRKNSWKNLYRFFEKLYTKKPSMDIKRLVSRLDAEYFRDLLIDYRIDQEDIISFNRRIEDLQKAFSQSNNKTLEQIMEPLFLKCELTIFEKAKIPSSRGIRELLNDYAATHWTSALINRLCSCFHSRSQLRALCFHFFARIRSFAHAHQTK